MDASEPAALTPRVPLPAADSPPSGTPLSRRELEVLGLMTRGASYRAIAQELQVSINTVRNHVRRLYQKLDVNSKAAAVATGIRQGLL